MIPVLVWSLIAANLSVRDSPPATSLSPPGLRGRNVTPRQPGQLRWQLRAVALDDEHGVSAAVMQVGGVAVRRVQRVSGDHHVGQIESVPAVGQMR